MVRVTKILSEEHVWIRLLLECLEEVIEGFQSGEAFDSKTASELQALFEGFVDGQHQDKEETALFPKLMERLHKLQQEHVQEREHLERMRFSLFNASLGDPAGRREFVREALAYLELQRRHMAKENLGLLPFAEQLLTSADDREVLEEFERREDTGPARDEVRERVRRLCSRCGVPFYEAAERAEVASRTN